MQILASSPSLSLRPTSVEWLPRAIAPALDSTTVATRDLAGSATSALSPILVRGDSPSTSGEVEQTDDRRLSMALRCASGGDVSLDLPRGQGTAIKAERYAGGSRRHPLPSMHTTAFRPSPPAPPLGSTFGLCRCAHTHTPDPLGSKITLYNFKITILHEILHTQLTRPSRFDLSLCGGAEAPRGGGRAGVLKNRKQKIRG